MHLNDTINVKKHYEQYKESGSNIAYIYKDFHKYIDSGKILDSKYISIKFDKRVEEFVKAVFEHVHSIETFITQEWRGLLPPKIRVMFLYSDGPWPYNPDLNETYMAVKSLPLGKSREVAASIVHETFHLVVKHLLERRSNFKVEMDTNSFKLFDEGYAQLIQAKFMNNQSDNRKFLNEYSKKIALTNSFNFHKMKSKWTELFPNQEVHIYNLTYSFTCFLEDKYGNKQLNALFFPTEMITDNSWSEYVENYFGSSIDDLIEEWIQKVTH